MGKNATILVGTLGQGIWRSTDGGETFERTRGKDVPQGRGSGQPEVVEFRHIASESQVRAMVVYPKDPRIIYAGAPTVESTVPKIEERTG